MKIISNENNLEWKILRVHDPTKYLTWLDLFYSTLLYSTRLDLLYSTLLYSIPLTLLYSTQLSLLYSTLLHSTYSTQPTRLTLLYSTPLNWTYATLLYSTRFFYQLVNRGDNLNLGIAFLISCSMGRQLEFRHCFIYIYICHNPQRLRERLPKRLRESLAVPPFQ